jgi:transcriptional regulator with XRE-family HTH domain
LSQYELAQALGFSRGQIANYEQGKREPDFATLITLANFFQVSLDYLLGRTENPEGSFHSVQEPGEASGEEVLRGIREDINEYEIEYLKESLKALRKFNESVSGRRQPDSRDAGEHGQTDGGGARDDRGGKRGGAGGGSGESGG